MPMETALGKAKGQLHQLQDHSNLAKSHYNVIKVGAGTTCTRNVPHRGHRLEGLEWGHTTSREGEGPRDLQTKLSNHRVLKRGEGKYYNPDPLYQLIGRVNEAKVKIDGCEVTGLIDSGANISSISKGFVDKLGLLCRQLQQLLEIEGSGGIDVPYLGYTKVNFQVPGVKALNEDILVVIQNDSACSKWVPIMLGTLHIDMVIEKATSNELQNLGREWKTGVLGAKVEARQVKLEGKIPSMIDQVDHDIKLSCNVTIQPRKALKSTGMVQLPVLSKWLNVTAEPMQNIGNFHDVHAIESYTTVKLGTKRVAIALVNNSGEKVTLKKGTKIGQLKAANVVPPSLAPCMSMDLNVLEYMQRMELSGHILKYEKPGMNTQGHKLPPTPELTPDRLDKLFSKLDFSGMEEWPEDV